MSPTVQGQLDGMVVLIAGGANGIGAAEARLFVERGARVVIGDVLGDQASQLAEEIGPNAIACRLDVRIAADWSDAVELGLATFGRPVTAMVNNAAVSNVEAVEHVSLESYLNVIMVNQVGSLLGLQACIPTMRAAGHGSVVIISSILGLAAHPKFAAYTSSKFGVRGLARVAALELAPSHIRVNTICPGSVDTRMLRGGETDPHALVPIAKQVPMGCVADADEIARASAFLVSRDAAYITGTDLVVDGGLMARAPLDLWS